jgi:IclR family acetate operon transcriptional repressor
VTSIAQFDAPHVLSANWVGRLAPLHASPSGKLALSLMPVHELDRFLEYPLARYTPTTITDPARLRVELTETRDRGYGSIIGEHEEGLNAVAAAVFRHDRAIAYVSAWGPEFRMPETRFPELGERLRSACSELADAKSFPHPVPA